MKPKPPSPAPSPASVRTQSPASQIKSKRPACLHCNRTGELCNVCGEAISACECGHDAQPVRCHICNGTGK